MLASSQRRLRDVQKRMQPLAEMSDLLLLWKLRKTLLEMSLKGKLVKNLPQHDVQWCHLMFAITCVRSQFLEVQHEFLSTVYFLFAVLYFIFCDDLFLSLNTRLPQINRVSDFNDQFQMYCRINN